MQLLRLQEWRSILDWIEHELHSSLQRCWIHVVRTFRVLSDLKIKRSSSAVVDNSAYIVFNWFLVFLLTYIFTIVE